MILVLDYQYTLPKLKFSIITDITLKGSMKREKLINHTRINIIKENLKPFFNKKLNQLQKYKFTTKARNALKSMK